MLIDDRPELRAAIEALEAPEEFDLEMAYGRAEAGRLVRVVLDRLPANYGNALEWKYMEGAVEEMASGSASTIAAVPARQGRVGSARRLNRYSSPRPLSLPRGSAHEDGHDRG